MSIKYAWIVLFLLHGFSCSRKAELKTVTVADFEAFVQATGYITDAEKYGWSIVQIDVSNYNGYVKGANWRKPDGMHEPASADLPVTQVSYNDALAYCAWAGTTLPSYDTYWDLVQSDKRQVFMNEATHIVSASKSNVLGNVWDLTYTEEGQPVRLAGGSIFCSITTCNGTDRNRKLYVDKETGNIHIGFSVMDYK